MEAIYNALATKHTITIPTKLHTKEIGMNTESRVFTKPKKLIPSSSGRGDAMMSPPKRNVNQRNILNLKSAEILRLNLLCETIFTK